ncbi:hypothetical protein KOW79_021101 [Hemibagrus wyckioides]|uniref:Uncharacterized protein n=1 Tax=Hemibagrus wyckioides TaxID=337641 RepID=A0A9D3N551_9TELE|nr:hypothetical protein KOW79_021101 [Hemibagrus wyckioides]
MGAWPGGRFQKARRRGQVESREQRRSRGEEYQSSPDAGELKRTLKHQKTLSKLSLVPACVPLEVVITAEVAERKEMNAAELHFLFTSVMLEFYTDLEFYAD